MDVFLTAVMCPGYTGSPVSCNDDAGNNQKILVGLQSFNWACNTPNVPAIYTSLRQMRQWIDYILEKRRFLDYLGIVSLKSFEIYNAKKVL